MPVVLGTIESIVQNALSTGTAHMIVKGTVLRSIIARTACHHATLCRSVLRGSPAGLASRRDTWARYAMSCACLTLVIAACSAATLAKAQSNQAPAHNQAAYGKLLDEAVTAFDASDFSRAHGLFSKAYE